MLKSSVRSARSATSNYSVRASRKVAAAVLAAVLSCGIVWAGDTPDRAEVQRLANEAVATAERWIEVGEPEKALKLLHLAVQEARLGGVDTVPARFMAAQALLQTGRYAAAAQILGQLSTERPDTDRFQLDYAAALFALGRDDAAKAVFRDVLRRERLPPTVRRNVEGFLERIRDRQRWRVDLDIGFWHDNNVNNASERETVDVPLLGGVLLPITLDQRPVRAWITRTGVRLHWREPVIEGGRAYIETRLSAARNTALSASQHNRTWASLSTGPRLGYTVDIAGQSRPGLAHADLGAEWRWRGGEAYAASFWAGMGIDQDMAAEWRTGVSARFWITRHEGESTDADPLGRSLGLRISRRIGPGWLTAGGTLSREEPERRSLRWTSREVSFAYVTDSWRDWSLSVRVNLTETGFDDEHPLFLTRREDRTHGLGLTLAHRVLAREGYLPEINLNWARTASTIPLHDRQLQTLRLGLRRLF